MTDEQLNIICAEAEGWVWRREVGKWLNTAMNLSVASLPDYGNDLNAMHRLEKTLGELGNWWSYCDHLKRIVTMDKGNETHVHATASQRREAFIRTIGKWVEL